MKNFIIFMLLTLSQNLYAENKPPEETSKTLKTPSSLSTQHLLSNIEELQKRIEQLEAHIHLKKALDANEKETYMPGWVMLAPENQTRLWYTPKHYLTDKGHVKRHLFDSDMVSCSADRVKIKNNPLTDNIGYICDLKYKIPNDISVAKARGYIISFAGIPNNTVRSLSIACSGKNGKFINDATWAGNSFMSYNYQPKPGNSRWSSSIISCPIVKDSIGNSFLHVRFGSGYKMASPDWVHSIASMIGYW